MSTANPAWENVGAYDDVPNGDIIAALDNIAEGLKTLALTQLATGGDSVSNHMRVAAHHQAIARLGLDSESRRP